MRMSTIVGFCCILAALVCSSPAPAADDPAPKRTVIFVDGAPRWEYRYLRNLLARQKNIDTSILLTSADKDTPIEGATALKAFPKDLQELSNYDLLIIGDVDPTYFTQEQFKLIAEFVRRGGGLIVSAGPKYMPHAYKDTPLAPILPIVIPDKPQDPKALFKAGYRIQITDAGLKSGVFNIKPDADQNQEIYEQEAAELFWFAMDVQPAPNAQVLAQHSTAKTKDQPLPLLVATDIDKGKSIYIGTDETWRWRFYTGEKLHETFWLNLLNLAPR